MKDTLQFSENKMFLVNQKKAYIKKIFRTRFSLSNTDKN